MHLAHTTRVTSSLSLSLSRGFSLAATAIVTRRETWVWWKTAMGGTLETNHLERLDLPLLPRDLVHPPWTLLDSADERSKSL